MGHEHHHHHHHEVNNYNFAFAVGVLLNIVFVVIEIVYGLLSDSLALVADAGHNFSDVLSLLLAWGASLLAAKSATLNRTYGFRKVTIFASLISAILLLFALGTITIEAFQRFFEPKPVESMTVIIVALIGFVINAVTALLFVKGQEHDLNIRGAFLHMAADAAVSLGVVVVGIVMMYTDWNWLDPLVTLLIVGVILIGTWHLLRDSTAYALDFVPSKIDTEAIKKFLQNNEKIESFHDLHIWALSTTEIALTVHLVVYDENIDNSFLHYLHQELHDHFHIGHATIQVESSKDSLLCIPNKKCQH
ncbi:cation diffusion facilitator family transporter [Sulfurimonas sp. C5]|uniref:cation diffusion facilitator family transporter n=1 Tax=Sulfurimonas sp. C5 TaxID=3036947 RepID=UPI0024563135|nr:cation diffusion facilitator family transporter [Sulfurimonas sp. C5]MDH4944222.1 cation diffusion facilitator family transporter [Sulfurimonas sp. C5]